MSIRKINSVYLLDFSISDLLEKINESQALGQLRSKQDALDMVSCLLSSGEDFAKEY